MGKIGLVTEEAADLPQDVIEKYQIAVTPVKMHWPEIEDLPGENTFEKMREAQKRGIESFGKTSQPSPKDFIDAFKKQLERFETVLCIVVTSKLSGTYNSAVQAKRFLEPGEQKRIFIVDSLSVSVGEALLVLEAIDLIKRGRQVEKIAKDLEEFIPQIHVFGIIEDPKWAEASGRIPTILANWMRKMARIGVRPLIRIKDGVVVSGGIITGAQDIPTAIFRRLEGETKKLKKEEKKIRVVITHGDDLEGARRLKEMIKRGVPNSEVAFLSLIDNVLGTLTGPNAILCGWCQRQEIPK